MPYFINGCRYCNGDNECNCNCHSATPDDIELGMGYCDPEVHD